MTGFHQQRRSERLKSAAAVGLCHAAIAYALLVGLNFDPSRATDDPLRVFNTNAPPPPPPPAPPRQETPPAKARDTEPEGAASPPNLKSAATPIVAPEPKVKPPDPPPIAAAPVPAEGAQRSSGVAPVPGPGTGAGGTGTGTGSGGSGSGSGSGGAPVRRARLIAGELFLSDYPPAVRRAGIGGAVNVQMTVAPSGRVSGCRVVASSGSPELDQTTCRLIMQRYRFDPARDAEGRAVPDLVGERHLWWSGRRRN